MNIVEYVVLSFLYAHIQFMKLPSFPTDKSPIIPLRKDNKVKALPPI